MSIQICPKCLKPYRPDKSVNNAFGIFAIGFKCKYCKYEGPGPIKMEEKDYEAMVKAKKKSNA